MSDSDDWAADPEAAEFLRHAEQEMAPKLAGSAFNISLVPSDYGDAKFWVELGASIMMDKPIIAVVTEGREVPAKLIRVCDEIVVIAEGAHIEDHQDALMDAIRVVIARLEQERGE